MKTRPKQVRMPLGLFLAGLGRSYPAGWLRVWAKRERSGLVSWGIEQPGMPAPFGAVRVGKYTADDDVRDVLTDAEFAVMTDAERRRFKRDAA